MKINIVVTGFIYFILTSGLLVSPAHSKDFPEKTVTVICPWAAGGGTDTILRGLARQTEPFLDQNITVINKTGGGGAIGHGLGIAARPDGYTVTMITFELISLPPQGLVPFSYQDYDLLMRVNMDPGAITVHTDAPYNTLAEFVSYAKEHPGAIKVGHSGPGSVWEIGGSIFAEKAGIDLTFVPYDGAAPAVTALVGKHIEAVSVSPAEVLGQVKAGNLKILAIMSDERLPDFPDVPTMKESGYNVSFGTWRGLAVPKDTPEDIKKVLHDAFKKGMDSPEFRKFAANSGFGLAYLNAEDWVKDLSVSSVDVANIMKKLGKAR